MSDHADDMPSTPSEDPAGEQLPLLELETLLARPFSWRKRLVQLSLLLAVVVVALVALRGVIVPSYPLPQPTPTLGLSTLSPALLVQSDVTYGTLTINGHQQSVSPPLTTAIAGQTYDLTLTAPPFRPVSCQVIIPPSPAAGAAPVFSHQGHCRVLRYSSANHPGTVYLHGVFADPSVVIEIDVTIADLSPAQQRQVTSLLLPPLTTQMETSVPPGELIATRVAPDGIITSTRASETLGATAFLAPSTAVLPQAPFCGAMLCPVDLSPYLYSAAAAFPTNPLWAVEVPMGLRWRFTRASGEVAADVSFPASGGIVVFLSFDAKEGWQIAQQAFVPGYGSIADQLPTTFCSAGILFLELLPRQPANSFPVLLHDQGIAGCALSLQQSSSNQPQNPIDLGHFIWRFGVLLAANANAQTLDPDLPLASPEEIAAVGG